MFEIKICLPQEHVELLSDYLMLLNAAAITLQDQANQPIYEPKPNEIIIWQDVTLNALFTTENDLENAKEFLKHEQWKEIVKHFTTSKLPEVNWVKESLRQFVPTKFGDHLWICPSWQQPTDANEINVFLDPGLAFGTGTHPTTALCLEWLDRHIKGGETVIDYGTGSGILALAALKLGAEKAYAIDYDPQALDACLNNAKLNNISKEQLQISPPDDAVKLTADVLIANILANPLIEYADHFANSVNPKGKIILSGILSEQAQHVITAYEKHFFIHPIIQKDEWILIFGEKC